VTTVKVAGGRPSASRRVFASKQTVLKFLLMLAIDRLLANFLSVFARSAKTQQQFIV
jgi:hypothetical protein